MAAGAIARGLAASLAAGLACALCASAVAMAAPGSDATVETISFNVNNTWSDDATVPCPEGKRAVGGGIGTTGPLPAPGGYFYVMQTTGPLDETATVAETRDGDVALYWSAYVHNRSGTAQRLRAFAICSESSDATIETTELLIASNSMAPVVAACPAGKRAVGGGVATTGPSFWGAVAAQYSVLSSGPLDDSGAVATTDDGHVARAWFAYVHNAAETQQLFKAFAICSQASDATIEATSFYAESGSASATASCPAGARALGGGVATTGPANFGPGPPPYTVQLSGPQDGSGSFATTDEGEVARSWHGSVYNQSAGQSFKAFALCAGSVAASEEDDGGGDGTTFKCSGRTATIVGTSGNDNLTGTPKPDVIAGLGGNDRLSGRDGRDRICGGPGDDRIRGGKGRDRLRGDDGRDRLAGGSGRDVLKGGKGKDRLDGGPGRDTLSGGPGLDFRKQ